MQIHISYEEKVKLAKRLLVVIGILVLILLVTLGITSINFLPSNEKLSAFAQQIKSVEQPVRAQMFTDSNTTDIGRNSALKVHGWIPVETMNQGLAKLEEKKEFYSSVSPVFYTLASNGEIKTNMQGLEEVRKIAKENSISLIPSIASFSADDFSYVLSDEGRRNDHIKFIISEVEKHQYDGFDLDYETIYLKDKDGFYDFVEKLNQELDSKNKLLSITVLAQWGDNVTYEFAPQTRQVQNYSELSQHADMFRIMAYDYTGSGNTAPGPIAPIKWVMEVMEYATQKVPKEKLILGIPTYNYLWESGTAKPANALQYDHIFRTKNYNSTAQDKFDLETLEGYIKYKSVNDGKEYTGYYASPESIRARIELAKKYNIAGISFWKIGRDPF